MGSAGSVDPTGPAGRDVRSATARSQYQRRSVPGLAIACAARFFALTLLVDVGGAEGLDVRIAQHFRQHDALVITLAHWPSDVLGGLLLAGAIVAGTGALPWRHRMHPGRGHPRPGGP